MEPQPRENQNNADVVQKLQRMALVGTGADLEAKREHLVRLAVEQLRAIAEGNLLHDGIRGSLRRADELLRGALAMRGVKKDDTVYLNGWQEERVIDLLKQESEIIGDPEAWDGTTLLVASKKAAQTLNSIDVNKVLHLTWAAATSGGTTDDSFKKAQHLIVVTSGKTMDVNWTKLVADRSPESFRTVLVQGEAEEEAKKEYTECGYKVVTGRQRITDIIAMSTGIFSISNPF